MEWLLRRDMPLDELKICKAGRIFIAENSFGAVAYIDTKEQFNSFPAVYMTLPFVADYNIKTGSGVVYGSDGDFAFSSVIENGENRKLIYISRDGLVRISVHQSISGEAVSQKADIENLSGGVLCLNRLYNKFGGIDIDCFESEYAYNERVKIGVVRGEWSAEGQFSWNPPDLLGVVRAGGHRTSNVAVLNSSAQYTTRKISPILYFQDQITKKVWAFQHFPDGPYSMNIGLTDAENVKGSSFYAAFGAGTNTEQGFRVYLKKGEKYETASTIFSCADSFDEVNRLLTVYRRNNLKRSAAPLMFNDYMNCLWTDLNERTCIPLIKAAKLAGAEGYCFDDGWYRGRNEHGSSHLGDWIPDPERFGQMSFQDMIKEITSRNMIAGLWTELEVCSAESGAANLPEDYFLTNDGVRIYRCGSFYFNFFNPKVWIYLKNCVKRIYSMGIRYIKNDYNGHPGAGVDHPDASPYASLEMHARRVNAFYKELRNEFPDLIMENCASGAMRADANTMKNFNIQSISDCEEYYKMPSIINGTLMNLLPEQVGIWSYPYPRIFWNMKSDSFLTDEYIVKHSDGRETAFNMINSFMGVMYLSGAIDKTDERNFSLICEAVKLYKELREFIYSSYPVYPLECAKLEDKNGFCAQGLKNGSQTLIAVWRRETQKEETSFFLPEEGNVSILYPDHGSLVKRYKDRVDVFLPLKNSAVLLMADL